MSYYQRKVVVSDAVERILNKNKTVLEASEISTIANKDFGLQISITEVEEAMGSERWEDERDIAFMERLHNY